MTKIQKKAIREIKVFLNTLYETYYDLFIQNFDFEKFRKDDRFHGKYFISQLQKTFKKYKNYEYHLLRKDIKVSKIKQDNNGFYFIVQLLNYKFKIGSNKKENMFYTKRIIDFCKLIDYSNFSKVNDPKFEFSTNSSYENKYSITCNRKFVVDFFNHYFENIFKIMIMDYNELLKVPKIHFKRIIFDYENIK